MAFNPFVNKLRFDAFVIEAEPCPKCNCPRALIAPTLNTHAASSRCDTCGRFYRWLGKGELSHLVAQQTQSKQPKQPDAAPGKSHPGASAPKTSTPAGSFQIPGKASHGTNPDSRPNPYLNNPKPKSQRG